MKRAMTLATLLLGTVVSGYASAATTGVINFTGTISAKTCNFTTFNGSGLNANSLDLGTYTSDDVDSGKTKYVSFLVIGKKADGTTCLLNKGETFALTLSPLTLWNSVGLTNAGTATGVGIQVLDSLANTPFSAKHTTTQTLTGTGPFKRPLAYAMQAKIMKLGTAPVTAGTVRSAVNFSVAYN